MTPHEQLGLAGWLGSALETNSLIIEEFFGAANSPDSPRPEVAMDHATDAHTYTEFLCSHACKNIQTVMPTTYTTSNLFRDDDGDGIWGGRGGYTEGGVTVVA